jgi:hypothetical protein
MFISFAKKSDFGSKWRILTQINSFQTLIIWQFFPVLEHFGVLAKPEVRRQGF